MPESKGREKRAYTPPAKPTKVKVGNPVWFVPVMLTLMVEAIDTSPALSRRFRDTLRRFRGFLADTVRIGQRKGAFRKNADPDRSAELFVASLLGLEIQYYQDPRSVDLHRSMHAATAGFCEWLGAPRARKPPGASRSSRGVLSWSASN